MQDEWRRGLKGLRADTVSKLKKTLPELEKEVECLNENFFVFWLVPFFNLSIYKQLKLFPLYLMNRLEGHQTLWTFMPMLSVTA